MSIETICTGCGKRLRVGEEHAGKLARCPQCQTTYTVPQAEPTGSLGGSFPGKPAASDAWQLRTGDGLTYGPVTKAELDGWLAEGRITPQSQILQTGTDQWKWAGEVYPQLSSGGPAALSTPLSAPRASTQPANSPFGPGSASPGSLGPGSLGNGNPFAENPFSEKAAASANPYLSPQGMSYGPRAGYNPTTGRYIQPHRGGLILALSILGLFFCAILSIVSLVMGLTDLSAMKAGRMDPSGRGVTIAGIIIGGLPLVLWALYIFIMIVADMN